MNAVLMDRPADVRGEWNHSCTPQCPNPCPAASSVEMPEGDVVQAPEMYGGR